MINNPTQIKNYIGKIVNQAVVRVTGAQGSIGINGFLFDITGDEEVMIDSDITDHFIETNSTIQDHITMRPNKITVSGFIGELNDNFTQNIVEALTTITHIKIVSPYLPEFTSQAIQFYTKLADQITQAVALADNILNSAKSLYGLFVGMQTSANKQQSAYIMFKQIWENQRISADYLCTVETPWKIYSSMAIESIRILQRDDNRFVSEFSITFKELRFVGIQTVAIQQITNQGSAMQSSPSLIKMETIPNNMNTEQTNLGVISGASEQNGQTLSIGNLKASFGL